MKRLESEFKEKMYLSVKICKKGIEIFLFCGNISK
jgi:hypothetical protein